MNDNTLLHSDRWGYSLQIQGKGKCMIKHSIAVCMVMPLSACISLLRLSMGADTGREEGLAH